MEAIVADEVVGLRVRGGKRRHRLANAGRVGECQQTELGDLRDHLCWRGRSCHRRERHGPADQGRREDSGEGEHVEFLNEVGANGAHAEPPEHGSGAFDAGPCLCHCKVRRGHFR